MLIHGMKQWHKVSNIAISKGKNIYYYDRIQTEIRDAMVVGRWDLVGSRQHGAESNKAVSAGAKCTR